LKGTGSKHYFERDCIKGTQGNSRELKGTQGNSRELKGTQGNTREHKGNEGNSREIKGTQGNPVAQPHLAACLRSWHFLKIQFRKAWICPSIWGRGHKQNDKLSK